MTDPSRMNEHEIDSLLTFWRQRQATVRPPEIFRWSYVQTGDRRSQERTIALYPRMSSGEASDEEPIAAVPVAGPKKGKKKAKVKSKKKPKRSEAVVMDTDDDEVMGNIDPSLQGNSEAHFPGPVHSSEHSLNVQTPFVPGLWDGSSIPPLNGPNDHLYGAPVQSTNHHFSPAESQMVIIPGGSTSHLLPVNPSIINAQNASLVNGFVFSDSPETVQGPGNHAFPTHPNQLTTKAMVIPPLPLGKHLSPPVASQGPAQNAEEQTSNQFPPIPSGPNQPANCGPVIPSLPPGPQLLPPVPSQGPETNAEEQTSYQFPSLPSHPSPPAEGGPVGPNPFPPLGHLYAPNIQSTPPFQENYVSQPFPSVNQPSHPAQTERLKPRPLIGPRYNNPGDEDQLFMRNKNGKRSAFYEPPGAAPTSRTPGIPSSSSTPGPPRKQSEHNGENQPPLKRPRYQDPIPALVDGPRKRVPVQKPDFVMAKIEKEVWPKKKKK